MPTCVIKVSSTLLRPFLCCLAGSVFERVVAKRHQPPIRGTAVLLRYDDLRLNVAMCAPYRWAISVNIIRVYMEAGYWVRHTCCNMGNMIYRGLYIITLNLQTITYNYYCRFRIIAGFIKSTVTYVAHQNDYTLGNTFKRWKISIVT